MSLSPELIENLIYCLAMYRCVCNRGFEGNGYRCKAVTEKKCSENFGATLKRLRVNDVKNPTSFVGENMVVMAIQTQMKHLRLNQMKYSGFIEFFKD